MSRLRALLSLPYARPAAWSLSFLALWALGAHIWFVAGCFAVLAFVYGRRWLRVHGYSRWSS